MTTVDLKAGVDMQPSDLVRRWIDAINRHDLDNVAACFAPGYEDEAPARAGEFVKGRDHVRQNFERFFTSIPDIRAELHRTVDQGSTVWMEWSMIGTRPNGTTMKFVGINMFEVQEGVFVNGRIYTELVREAGGIEAQVRRMAGEKSSS